MMKLENAMNKVQIMARLDFINAESERLAEELRELMWKDTPDDFYNWSEELQKNYWTQDDRAREALKQKRDQLEDEGIELSNSLMRKMK